MPSCLALAAWAVPDSTVAGNTVADSTAAVGAVRIAEAVVHTAEAEHTVGAVVRTAEAERTVWVYRKRGILLRPAVTDYYILDNS